MLIKLLNSVVDDDFVQGVPDLAVFVLLSDVGDELALLQRAPLSVVDGLALEGVLLEAIDHLLLVNGETLVEEELGDPQVLHDVQQVELFSQLCPSILVSLRLLIVFLCRFSARIDAAPATREYGLEQPMKITYHEQFERHNVTEG